MNCWYFAKPILDSKPGGNSSLNAVMMSPVFKIIGKSLRRCSASSRPIFLENWSFGEHTAN